MCLSPITIINPTKYINPKFRDSFLLQVPCNHCADCQSRNSQEWMYRTYYEFSDCISQGGFVYFDTLTYSNEYVPRISQFGWSDSTDMCFNHKHITDFMKRLRISLARKYSASCRYFLASEYGADNRFSHRPHYHVLFFVHGCTWQQFSLLVAESWRFGRTDGIGYKSSYYVGSHNVIASQSDANFLRASNYVTKYVQKSCTFQKQLNKRINEALRSIANKMPDSDSWLESVHASRVRQRLTRSINQFHRQSLHFGESALMSLDINELFKTGTLYAKHFKGILQPIGLPTYYKRKLFYELVEVDGNKIWQLTELGINYKIHRLPSLLHDLTERYNSIALQFNHNFDCQKLADYTLNLRGRFKANNPSWTLENRLVAGIPFFNYCTPSDREHLGNLGIVTNFLGNCTLGYRVPSLPRHYKFSQFISKFVYLDPKLEHQLDVLNSHSQKFNHGKQAAYELRQRLTNLYKIYKS